MGIFTGRTVDSRKGEIKRTVVAAKIRACLYFFSRGHRASMEFYDAGFQPSSVSRQCLTGIRTCRCFEHGRLIIPLCLVCVAFYGIHGRLYSKGLKGAPLSASEGITTEKGELSRPAFRSNHGISSIMNEMLLERSPYHRWKSPYLSRDKRIIIKADFVR